MNQPSYRFLPLLVKAVAGCVGAAFAYWWITDGVTVRDFCIAGGVVNYCAAAFYFQRARRRLRSWVSARGKIIDMEQHSDGDGESPVVAFSDRDGGMHEFTNFMGGSNWYRVGYRVDVLYDPLRPKNAQLNDWSSLWAITAIGLATGTVFLVVALFLT